jgi:hypothetical protein
MSQLANAHSGMFPVFAIRSRTCRFNECNENVDFGPEDSGGFSVIPEGQPRMLYLSLTQPPDPGWAGPPLGRRNSCRDALNHSCGT